MFTLLRQLEACRGGRCVRETKGRTECKGRAAKLARGSNLGGPPDITYRTFSTFPKRKYILQSIKSPVHGFRGHAGGLGGPYDPCYGYLRSLFVHIYIFEARKIFSPPPRVTPSLKYCRNSRNKMLAMWVDMNASYRSTAFTSRDMVSGGKKENAETEGLQGSGEMAPGLSQEIYGNVCFVLSALKLFNFEIN